jgi:hypothetical protein
MFVLLCYILFASQFLRYCLSWTALSAIPILKETKAIVYRRATETTLRRVNGCYYSKVKMLGAAEG